MNIDYILQNHGIGTGKKSKDITPPPPCTNFTATSGNELVTLSWTNPIDTDFVGIKILRKEGSYPTSPTDGVIVYSGANTSYTDNTVTNGTTYYYRAFTFDYDNNFNTTTSGQQTTVTPIAYIIYGVKIDTTNNSPSTAVTYIENSIGFTPASGNNGTFSYGSWIDKFPFNQIKPCVLKLDGTVNYYLDTTDYTKKLDGTESTLSSPSEGNVMIEFPKIYWKIETIGTDVFIRYSDVKIDSTYKCLAHLRGTTEKSKCYIGAFLGYYASAVARLCSITSPNIPTVSQTIGTFRTQAQANGIGHDIIGYFQLLMLQILYTVMFKNLDSQTALGRGYVDTNVSGISIGNTKSKGMYYGETTGKLQMKCFGIEDLWGNVRTFIDGLYIDANRNLLIGNQSFNNNGSGYTNYGLITPIDVSGYLKSAHGTTEKGFLISEQSYGSSTTYFCDTTKVSISCIPVYGGYYAGGSSSGVFHLDMGIQTTTTAELIASRLMYL